MKLITELHESTEYLVEADEKTGKKNHYIKGIFAQSETKNRNKRVYPRGIMEREINSFSKMIEGKRALGELNHPQGPQINLDKVSHIITEMWWEGNDVYGKAKILGTPMGNIAKNFLDEGVQLGVSTRGMGSVKQMREGYSVVLEDFRLSTVDIVADPSGPDCFVNGIMEGTDWLYDEASGMYRVAEELQSTMRKMSARQIDEQKVELFKQFMIKLGSQ